MGSNVIQPSVLWHTCTIYMCHKSLSCEFCDITSHNCRFFDIPMDILPKIGSSADSEFYGTIVSASPPGHWFVFSILQTVTKVKWFVVQYMFVFEACAFQGVCWGPFSQFPSHMCRWCAKGPLVWAHCLLWVLFGTSSFISPLMGLTVRKVSCPYLLARGVSDLTEAGGALKMKSNSLNNVTD